MTPRGCCYRAIGLALAAVALLCTASVAAQARQGATLSPIEALQRSRWIPEGSVRPSHVVYVFTDPDCSYCRALWLALLPYFGRGLQVRELLVGVISASSAGKAVAIMESRDPSAALRMNEARWGHGPVRGGGIAPIAHPRSGDLRRLADNEMLMDELGIDGTPGLVYADSQGKVNVISGLPSKMRLPAIVRAASASGVPERNPPRKVRRLSTSVPPVSASP